MATTIYCLKESGTDNIFYIGRTSSSLKRRLKQHINSSRENKYKLHEKIRELNYNIEIHPLEVITDLYLNPYKLEIQYIKQYSLKYSLVNTQYLIECK